MQQLTVFCSDDLAPRVIDALEGAGVEAFLQLGGGSGRAFNPAGEVPRTVDWEALLFVVPVADDHQVERVTAELAAYAGSCATEPCLRVVALPAHRLL